MAGKASRVSEWLRAASWAWQGWRGEARLGWRVGATPGKAGMACRGRARFGPARQGMAGAAGSGLVWLGSAGQGRQGSA